MGSRISRRQFTTSAAYAGAGLALPASAWAQVLPPSVAHADVSAMERERVLADAGSALRQPVVTITSTAAPRTGVDAHEFFSEIAPQPTEQVPLPKQGFREHATILRRFSNAVATLTAAYMLTHDDQYALRAGQHLSAWFVQDSTRMNPQLTMAGCPTLDKTSAGKPQGVVDAVPLAEVARAMSFLVDTAALSPPDLETAHQWLASLLTWLNTSREPVIAREAKDHSATAWLLLAAAISRSLRDTPLIDACTHRFRKPTLRNQINANGVFPHEITTGFPFRNTLMNFDMLTGACQLLSTPFDNLWDFELEDGPGMRSIVAFLFPALRDRAKWPYIADPQHFRDLPGRRAGLLFCGRAYNRPEYVDVWRTTPAPDMNALPDTIAASFPIHEPMLWTARALHGL